MKKYNDTTYAILGILTTDCKSGYAIKQLIDRSLNHFWKISYGQIYPILKLIVQEGLAEVHSSTSEGKPDKKEYFLTPKGTDTLKSWLDQPVEQPPLERNEILLKLFFGQYQSQKATVNLLQDYHDKLKSRYQTYVSIEHSIINHQDDDANSMYWLITLDYGKRTTRAAMDWCEYTLKEFFQKEEQ